MHVIDRLEKIGRLILWLCLAGCTVAVPVGLHIQTRQAADLAERTRLDVERATAQAEKVKNAAPVRLTLESMGLVMRAADNSHTGFVWFTNVSPRSGVVCIQGTATNSRTKESAHSLPACQEVGPYASAMSMKLMF